MNDGPPWSVDAAEAASSQLHGIQFREVFFAMAVASTHTASHGARAVDEIDNGRHVCAVNVDSGWILSLT